MRFDLFWCVLAHKPDFLEFLDQKEKENKENKSEIEENIPEINSPAGQVLQKQLQQIAGGQPVLQNVVVSSAAAAASNNTGHNPSKFQQCIAEGDLEFVS